jgi:hypothetical protein
MPSNRRVSRLFVRAWILWSIVWAVVLMVAFVASNGEPICDGPLILDVTDSIPPQCTEPIGALPRLGILLYVVGLAPSMILAAFVQARLGAAVGRISPGAQPSMSD